jgi:hypothetical protein
MNDQSPLTGWQGAALEDLGKSLFPTFAVNVPLPSHTSEPVSAPAPSQDVGAPASE